MATGMDMSLDDIIKRSTASRRRSRGSPYGPGPDRRFAVRSETTPYFIPQGRVWPRQVLQPNMMVLDGRDAESGTKIYISNLDYGVSNDDIKLLFSEDGELKRYSIHYDKSGRSKGTAEVVFTRRSDALAVIKKYNNMKLDGKPLQIDLVGTSLVTPSVMPPFQSSILGPIPNDVHLRGGGGYDGSRFHNGGFARGHLPRVHGEEKGHIEKVSFRDLDDDLERYHRLQGAMNKGHHNGKVSARDLDDDLEKYHLGAMQINKENGK